MPDQADQNVRCLAMLTALSQEHKWTLDDDQRHAYAIAIGALLLPDSGDDELRRQVTYYHLDHDLVRSLLDSEHPEHGAAWGAWFTSALRIVQHTGLASNTDDPMMSPEDLAQIGLEELLQSLPEFAYRSRFTTWAYPIIVRAARRYWNYLGAAKRSGPKVSINSVVVEEEAHVQEDEQPEESATAKALAQLIDTLLKTKRDERLAQIFHLWAIEDQRLADIARIVGLDPSRVSVLLKEARNLLQGDPAIREWINDSPGQLRK